MDPIIVTFVILGLAIICFVTEIIPLGATTICVPIALYFTGVIDSTQMVAGIVDSTVLMFLFMFIVGGCFLKSGLAKTIGEQIAKVMKTETSLMLGFMLFTCILSAFLSNTGTTVTVLPIIIGTCEAKGYNPIKHILGVGFSAQVGGMLALPGCPPNATVKSFLEGIGTGQTFGFLEYAIVGAPVCVIMIVYYLTIGQKIIPKNKELVKKAKMDPNAVYKAKDQIIVGIVFILVVISMALESVTGIPLFVSAMVGAVVLMLFKVVGPEEAFEEYVDWNTIMVIAGMLPMGTALQVSGAADLIANTAMNVIGDSTSPILYSLVIFIIGAFLTQFMSNSAATALLSPIIISIAQGVGMDPKFALMTLCMSASCSFLTPMATPVNTIVMGYTGFTFNDFLKTGILPLLIIGVFMIFYIPFIWA